MSATLIELGFLLLICGISILPIAGAVGLVAWLLTRKPLG